MARTNLLVAIASAIRLGRMAVLQKPLEASEELRVFLNCKGHSGGTRVQNAQAIVSRTW